VSFEGDRPFLVTALLAQCSEGADADSWWAAPVGARIAALLRLTELSDRQATLELTLRCPHAACHAGFDVSLPIDQLIAHATRVDRIPVSLPDGQVLIVRPPTGDDLRRWSRASYPAPHAAIVGMTDALVVEGQVSDDDGATLSVIETALAEHDPLVDFTVSCVCPTCAVPSEIGLDLERVALDRLTAIRAALLDEVHVLASAYGWSEREILGIAPERRGRYRDLINGAPR